MSETPSSLSFVHELRPVRTLFGAGRLGELGDEVERLGWERVLVISTPGRGEVVDRAVTLLGPRAAGSFPRAVEQVPRALVDEAVERVAAIDADGCVAIGGGSAIGLGKALALETGLPLLAVPTTYSGSEMTAIWGLSDGGYKTTGRDARVAPRTVIYDPLLTLTLPPSVSAPSGMNALAHCLEALYAADATPITSLVAEEGMRVLGESLPRLMDDPADLAAREGAFYGAHLAGWTLDGVSMGLHHKLCHTLAGAFGLPHALTHAVMLPYSATYNRDAAPEAMRRVARALGAADTVGGLFALNDRLGIPSSLGALGFAARDIERAASLALQKSYPNPRPVTEAGVRALLRNAVHGRRPAPGTP